MDALNVIWKVNEQNCFEIYYNKIILFCQYLSAIYRISRTEKKTKKKSNDANGQRNVQDFVEWKLTWTYDGNMITTLSTESVTKVRDE